MVIEVELAVLIAWLVFVTLLVIAIALSGLRGGGMTILRACIQCGVPTKDGYCPEHSKPKPWATSRHRERMGLSGGAWETLRQKVLAQDFGTCTCVMEAARTVWTI